MTALVARPKYHFTPARHWMNDPNGLVVVDGTWHLFFQHNPHGPEWGHMSWGHAVSPDMVHWKHLPVALYEENDIMIFSGSAVVDWKNTSAFGKDGKPPLVAIYTGHYTKKPLQDQQIAYSNDRGRTWTKYEGNPVLDIGETNTIGLFIPCGVAHGFYALTDATLMYVVNQYYDGGADENGVAWNDPELGVAWGVDSPILSPRDQHNPLLKDIPADKKPN